MPRLEATRRQILAGTAAALLLSRVGKAAGKTMMTRAVPKSGEALPVIGMGTYDTFDVGAGPEERKPLVEVMRLFQEAGGRVIDSSPMYGKAEGVVGDVLGDLGRPKMFLATKVWIDGKEAGIEQMKSSMKKMGGAAAESIDLMQIHNLRDWKLHLQTLREWKAAGRVRHIGITHYVPQAFAEMQTIIEKEGIDFVQLPYSLAMREAEKRLLPAAAANKVAVLVMRPFEKGALFGKLKGQALPAWATTEWEATSWAQLFLKFIVSHPAVTCVIPATSNPRHLQDNVSAGFGRLPEQAQRQKLVALLG